MKDTLQKFQAISVRQGELLSELMRIGLDGNQRLVDFQSASLRQWLELLASQGTNLLEAQARKLDPTVTGRLAEQAIRACGEYLQGNKVLLGDLQQQTTSLLRQEGQALASLLTEALSGLGRAHPGSGEALETTLRSFTEAAQKSFDQAAAWQRHIEIASENGSRALAALTTGATQGGTPAKRRTGAAA
jgi:hypothetical protein